MFVTTKVNFGVSGAASSGISGVRPGVHSQDQLISEATTGLGRRNQFGPTVFVHVSDLEIISDRFSPYLDWTRRCFNSVLPHAHPTSPTDGVRPPASAPTPGWGATGLTADRFAAPSGSSSVVPKRHRGDQGGPCTESTRMGSADSTGTSALSTEKFSESYALVRGTATKALSGASWTTAGTGTGSSK